MEFLTCLFEIKSDNSNDGLITGYGSVFGNVDSYGNIVAKGAFKKSIGDVMTGAKSWPAMLLQHGDETSDGKTPIGVWDFNGRGRPWFEDDRQAGEYKTWPRRLCASEDDSPARVGWSLNRLSMYRLRTSQGWQPGTSDYQVG